MSKRYTLGIDLGTYNSAAAVLKSDNKVEPISATPDRRRWRRTRESIKPFPSVVVYQPNGTVRAVGYEAKEVAEAEPEFAIWGVKRLLGKTYREASEHGELERMLMPVEPDDSNGRCMFMFEARDVRPEDVCAEMLRVIRTAAEEQTRANFDSVVVSVPAYFDAIAVSATVEAARLAGFSTVDTIPEPVAAALAHDLNITPRPMNFLVFDLGAGTLDVTAAEVWRSGPGPAGLSCNCRKNTGDTHLGGLDMDDRLVELLCQRLNLCELTDDARLSLRRAAEAAKIELSSVPEADISVEVDGRGQSYRLSRFDLEESLRANPKDLLEACEEQIRLALKGAEWRPEDVDQLLLVGGPTAMPIIREMLEKVFYRNPAVLEQIKATPDDGGLGNLDPMLAVSIGAARSKGTRLKKVHPYGYGFVNERMEKIKGEPMYRVYREPCMLIRRDSIFPSKIVTVTADNPYYRRDKIFSIEVLQEVPEAEQNVPGHGNRRFRYLGDFSLAFRRLPFLMQMSMSLNENGELETTIRNLHGSESATYVGIGSLQRHPIDLPTSRLVPESESEPVKPTFLPEEAEKVKQWGNGFFRFLSAKYESSPGRDRYLRDGLEDLRISLSRFGEHPEEGVNRVFSVGKTLLLRAQEVKVMTESERHRFEDELDAAREKCFRWRDR